MFLHKKKLGGAGRPEGERSGLSDGRIWWGVTVANAVALAAALLAGVLGAKTSDIISVLTIFVYLETFVAILWYTTETRRMQGSVAQQARETSRIQESATRQASLIAHSLRCSLYDNMLNQMMQIDQLFVSNPHLRPYFYENVAFVHDPTDEANTKLYNELSAVAECLLDFLESVILNKQEFLDTVPGFKTWNEHSGNWDAYIKAMFETSPFLNYHLDKYQHWYVQVFSEYRKSYQPAETSATDG